MNDSANLSLIVRKTIAAQPVQVFQAWTQANILKKWWGPQGVTCHEAEVDLRVGGAYRIGNTLPGGEVIWITGHFEVIEKNEILVYTWSTGDDHTTRSERVTVKFNAIKLSEGQNGTEVIVIHEQIENQERIELHRHGWEGCLDGLEGLQTLQKSELL